MRRSRIGPSITSIRPNAEQNPAWGKGSSKMTTWRYQVFVISVGAQAGADVLGHQGLQDQLNDLGQDGWELTAVTDAGDAKIFILKQPDIVDPLALA